MKQLSNRYIRISLLIMVLVVPFELQAGGSGGAGIITYKELSASEELRALSIQMEEDRRNAQKGLDELRALSVQLADDHAAREKQEIILDAIAITEIAIELASLGAGLSTELLHGTPIGSVWLGMSLSASYNTMYAFSGNPTHLRLANEATKSYIIGIGLMWASTTGPTAKLLSEIVDKLRSVVVFDNSFKQLLN